MEPFKRKFARPLEHHGHQIVLAPKVLIHGPLGDLGSRGDFIDRNPDETLLPKQSISCIDDAMSRLKRRH